MADVYALRLLLFRIDDLLCALEVTAVREILEAPPATRIPGAPAAVEGLVNVRGELVTLIDGGRLLGRRAAQGSALLLVVGRHAVGLTVDEVQDLVTAPLASLSRREELPGVDPALVRGVGRSADQAWVLLDLDALLDPILTT